MSDVLNVEQMDINAVRQILGGSTISTRDFIICSGLRWDSALFNQPYRSNAAAFVFCTGGHMTITIGVRKFTLRSNGILIYGPGHVIELLDGSDDFKASILIITRDFAHKSLIDLKTIMPIYQYLSEETNDLLELGDDEMEIVNGFLSLLLPLSKHHSELAVFNLLASMFRTISEMFARHIPEQPAPRIRTRQEEYLEHFLLTISKNYKTERSVQFYADQLHITPKYLSTVIKEVSGLSAAEWIDRFVIQESKVLLKFSKKSIQEITYELNFSTQSFFGKYFKRHTGISPSQYRSGKEPTVSGTPKFLRDNLLTAGG